MLQHSLAWLGLSNIPVQGVPELLVGCQLLACGEVDDEDSDVGPVISRASSGCGEKFELGKRKTAQLYSARLPIPPACVTR